MQIIAVFPPDILHVHIAESASAVQWISGIAYKLLKCNIELKELTNTVQSYKLISIESRMWIVLLLQLLGIIHHSLWSSQLDEPDCDCGSI